MIGFLYRQSRFRFSKLSSLLQFKQPTASQKSVLITSALPYVNNVPHLGNVIGSVLSADVFARYNRSLGNNTLFICGTDEYGTATQVKALKQKKTPKEICDKYHEIHKKIYEWFKISFNHFGRTSSLSHSKIVQNIFLDLDKNGLISQKQSEQHYCNNCDLFLADRYIKGECPVCSNPDAKGDQCQVCNKLVTPSELKNPKCLICQSAPQVKKTKHLYLKTGVLKSQLQEWVVSAYKDGHWSHNAKSITNQWMDNLISERSISRDLKWGVPIPKQGYQNKVFYVWFDAPIGYISITAELLPDSYQKWWNNSLNVDLYQFMGKDNVTFHSIIFPACLIGANKSWNLVNSISATEYLMYEGTKFSKSAETGVFCDIISQLNIDVSAWRYYLLYNRPERFDRNFSWADFLETVNRDLVNNIGNLFQRVLTLATKQLKGNRKVINVKQSNDENVQFIQNVEQVFKNYVESMSKIELREGMAKLIEISSLANKYLQTMCPWTQQNIESGKSQVVIEILLNYLVLLSSMMQPFVPDLAQKGYEHLGFNDRNDIRRINYFKGQDFINRFLLALPQEMEFNKPTNFVTPLKASDIEIYKEKFGQKSV